jgi:hypothetical protein
MGHRLAVALGAVARRSGKGHWNDDKQRYIVEHIVAPSLGAPASESCSVACMGQIGSIQELGQL